MKYLLLGILTLLLTSCDYSTLESVPTTVSSTKQDLLWNNNQSILDIDLRQDLNEESKTLTLPVVNQEYFFEFWNNIREGLNKNLEEAEVIYDQVNFTKFRLRAGNFLFHPIDYNDFWIGKIDRVEVVYLSNNGEKDIVLGEHLIDLDKNSYEMEFDMNNTNLIEEITTESGNISLRVVFNQIPKSRLRILGYQLRVVGEYDLVHF